LDNEAYQARGGDSSAGAPQLLRHPVVELGFEYVDERNVDRAFLEQAMTPLRELPLAGNIRVVVTSQMDDSLAARVNERYIEPFHQGRIIGRVTAKTVTDQSSSTEILLDAAALLPNVRLHIDGGIQRLLGHEGHHLVLRDRGEDARSCVRATCANENTAEGAIGWIAALAVEEYRIEAALCAQGVYGLSYDDELPPALFDWYETLAVAGEFWGSGQGERILTVTNEIITRSAHVAAAHRFGHPLTDSTLSSSHWTALIGHSWQKLLLLTERIPPATARVELPELTAMVRDVAGLVGSWCKLIGFELVTDTDGFYLWPLNVVSVDRSAA
jgi:hypothetical protein